MVNCPKCGFSQPRDQYCASCGVDMLAFKPKEKPLLNRIISNVAVQLCTLGIVVFAFFLFVRHQQKMEIASRLAEIEKNEPIQILAAEPEPTPRPSPARPVMKELASAHASDEVTPVVLAAKALAAAADPETSAPAATVSGSTKPASVAPSSENPPANASPLAASIRVGFHEVPRAIYGELLAEARGTGRSFGSIQVGIANDWSDRAKSARGTLNWRSLDTTQPQDLKVGETTTIHRGTQNATTGEDYGVWIFAKLIRVEEGSITVQLDLSRNLPNASGTGGVEQVNHLPLPEITIPKGSAIFIGGLIPHRQIPLTPNEIRLLRGDRVMSILSSEPFRTNATDFLVTIE